VTSVILNISVVRYIRRHLVCTTDCLHEQEWWILMRWSFEEVDRHFFSIKSSLWALTAAYTKFRRMIRSRIWSCGHRSCTSEVYCYLIETPGDFIGEKLKAYNFVISEWVKPLYRCWSAILVTTAEAQFWLRQPWRNLPLFFPPSFFRLQPLPFLTRVWPGGYHHGKIVN